MKVWDKFWLFLIKTLPLPFRKQKHIISITLGKPFTLENVEKLEWVLINKANDWLIVNEIIFWVKQ